MNWLIDFASIAAQTDQLKDRHEYAQLLATGLAGESGSILSEMKKQRREQQSFVARRVQMREEIGDFVWYYVRLVQLIAPKSLPDLVAPEVLQRNDVEPALAPFLELAAATGEVMGRLVNGLPSGDLQPVLQKVWEALIAASVESGISLRESVEHNRLKIEGRWPLRRVYTRLFDADFPDDEQLPRLLDIEFRQTVKDGRPTVLLRCNGINLGDRLTDNIRDQDGYRFHDVFHFANMVYLGWSPIARGLFRCKRKSNPRIDEAEDGARAGIIEEAISAMVFGRAKHLNFFERASRVDYDLLKNVRILAAGYEVEAVPMWQWEAGILDGYRVFRELRAHGGGKVQLDMLNRTFSYEPPLVARKAQ